MTHDAIIATLTRSEESVRAVGHDGVIRAAEAAADQGTLPAGLLLSRDAAGKVVPYGETADEAVGTGDGTAVTDEAVDVGDGGETDFNKTFSGGPIEPGSLVITDGVETFADDGIGGLWGDAGGSGSADYAGAQVSISFAAAPSNEADITASYAVGAKDFSKTFSGGPIEPGSLVITDGVETFADDGFGRLRGDAGGSGSVDYAGAQASIRFAAAPLDGAAITATYHNKLTGVLDRVLDTTKSTAALEIIHGTVNQTALKVGASDPESASATDIDRLTRLGVYPV
jgi:hypothetical protein